MHQLSPGTLSRHPEGETLNEQMRSLHAAFAELENEHGWGMAEAKEALRAAVSRVAANMASLAAKDLEETAVTEDTEEKPMVITGMEGASSEELMVIKAMEELTRTESVEDAPCNVYAYFMVFA